MIASMTGYGKAEQIINERNIAVEIKSVNSRYFEFSARMPRTYVFLEDKIKKLINESVKRGKVELNLSVQSLNSQDVQVSVNKELAKSYFKAVKEISVLIGRENTLTPDALARFNDVLIHEKAQQDEDSIWQDIQCVINKALESFCAMRSQEAQNLKQDILMRVNMLEAYTKTVEELSEERVEKYKDKLYARLSEILQSTNIDEARILTEAAIFADKTAVDEETTRLKSHFEQYKEILNEEGAIGRKLDFLTQELNRETNTIGSKCNEISITRTVVEMKAEIEKIREQVQNIE